MPTTNKVCPYQPAASAEARIESFEKKPDSGGMPVSASAPITNAMYVRGRNCRRPPIFRMSCSPMSAWMTMPAARKSSALKKACVIRWNIELAYAPSPAARNM